MKNGRLELKWTNDDDQREKKQKTKKKREGIL